MPRLTEALIDVRDTRMSLNLAPAGELLRFSTAGSVDDGKSTLIGRLLFETKQIVEDQLEAVERASQQQGADYVNLALLTDGLRAEREQGITIDVAYRYFATPARKFIIADTPGHAQYTRNMVTGASTANAAVVLVDARKGVLEQSRRHALLASLLRVPHLVVCVNKMDLVDYSQDAFDAVREQFGELAPALDVEGLTFIPVSALEGDNVTQASENMPWYGGPSLLEYLENVPAGSDPSAEPFRFPIQSVIRPYTHEHHDYRGYAGQVASGVVRVGDEVVVQPAGVVTRITAIDTFDGDVRCAFRPMSVTLRFEDYVDASRGDMISRRGSEPEGANELDAVVCWFGERPLNLEGKYLVKHTTRTTPARVSGLAYRLNVNELQRETADTLTLNEIGQVRIRTASPLLCDPYAENRATGRFVLIDALTNQTVAAGTIQ